MTKVKLILLLILLVMVGGAALFVLLKYLSHKSALKKQAERVQSRIKPVRDDIKAGKTPPQALLESLAANVQTRSALFECLRELKKQELFPAKYLDQKALAESDLAYWLSGPSGLGDYPDEIEFKQELLIDSGTPAGKVTYMLFRFRKKNNHWSSGIGWIAGVAGPYVEGQPLHANAPGVYSSMLGFDKQGPDKHVLSAHHILKQKGVYVGLPAAKKQTAKPAAAAPAVAAAPAAQAPIAPAQPAATPAAPVAPAPAPVAPAAPAQPPAQTV